MSSSRAINDEIDPLAAKRFCLPSECAHCTNKRKAECRTGPDSTELCK